MSPTNKPAVHIQNPKFKNIYKHQDWLNTIIGHSVLFGHPIHLERAGLRADAYLD